MTNKSLSWFLGYVLYGYTFYATVFFVHEFSLLTSSQVFIPSFIYLVFDYLPSLATFFLLSLEILHR